MKYLIASAIIALTASTSFAQESAEPLNEDQQVRREMRKEHKQEKWEETKETLQLTAEQEAQWKAIHEEYKGKHKELREQGKNEETKAAHKALRQEIDSRIMAILTSEQQEAWEKMKMDKKRERKSQNAKGRTVPRQ